MPSMQSLDIGLLVLGFLFGFLLVVFFSLKRDGSDLRCRGIKWIILIPLFKSIVLGLLFVIAILFVQFIISAPEKIAFAPPLQAPLVSDLDQESFDAGVVGTDEEKAQIPVEHNALTNNEDIQLETKLLGNKQTLSTYFIYVTGFIFTIFTGFVMSVAWRALDEGRRVSQRIELDFKSFEDLATTSQTKVNFLIDKQLYEQLRVAAYLEVVYELVAKTKINSKKKEMWLIQLKSMLDCQNEEEALVVTAELSTATGIKDSLLPSAKRYIEFLRDHDKATPEQRAALSDMLK